jgi:hypothetical protein
MTNYALICDTANFIGLAGLILILNNSLKIHDRYTIYYLLTGIFMYFHSRINNIPKLIEIYHYMQAFAFILIPYISYSKGLLHWHLFFMIFTLASRKKIGGCIVRKLESDNPLTQNSFTDKFDWDIIFPLLAVSSLANLYIYH